MSEVSLSPVKDPLEVFVAVQETPPASVGVFSQFTQMIAQLGTYFASYFKGAEVLAKAEFGEVVVLDTKGAESLVVAAEPEIEQMLPPKVEEEKSVTLSMFERLRQNICFATDSLGKTARAHPHATAALIAAGIFGISVAVPALIEKLRVKVIPKSYEHFWDGYAKADAHNAWMKDLYATAMISDNEASEVDSVIALERRTSLEGWLNEGFNDVHAAIEAEIECAENFAMIQAFHHDGKVLGEASDVDGVKCQTREFSARDHARKDLANLQTLPPIPKDMVSPAFTPWTATPSQEDWDLIVPSDSIRVLPEATLPVMVENPAVADVAPASQAPSKHLTAGEIISSISSIGHGAYHNIAEPFVLTAKAIAELFA